MRTEMNPSQRTIRKRRSGTSLAEYALLGVLVTVTCYSAMQLLGSQIDRIVISSCNSIASAIQGVLP